MSINLARKLSPGINVGNVKKAFTKLSEAIGHRWVSRDRAVTSAYYRDFTLVKGKRPNIVTLPGSTEEVKKVMEIAYEHNLPIVPVSTGFNHGGLTLPRLGGVLVDLKRMDKIEFDREAMTYTIQPHARNAAVHASTESDVDELGIHMRPALSLSMGSTSMLANYISRGGSGVVARYGANTDLIVNMTWVLTDGTILKMGPGAAPWIDDSFCPYGGVGVDYSGMFMGCDAQFGICTEVTLRAIPEHPIETNYLLDYKDKKRDSLPPIIEFMYALVNEDITDFQYKMHHGNMAALLHGLMPQLDAEQIAPVLPDDPITIIIGAMNEEEKEIKEKILFELAEEHGFGIFDTSMFGELPTDPGNSKKIGPTIGSVMRHRGAFQWTAGGTTLDRMPPMIAEFDKIFERYYMESDEDKNYKHFLTGSALQGPYTMGRCGALEFDFWWDQGNPEEVKKARDTMRKTSEMFVSFGAPTFRLMYGDGDMILPLCGRYYQLYRDFKKMMDPENLMHPHMQPLTDDSMV